MADSLDWARWVAFAEDDLESGLELLTKHPRNASTLFQQAAEKYLDLVDLLAALDPALSPTSPEAAAAGLISETYPDGRYPGDLAEPDVPETKALARAAGVLSHRRRQAGRPAGSPPRAG